ncbi:hypothetical protein BFL35_01495 [Clavibacter michiganensis]|nr:hypothetical protein BFL35_01495 [Clavibacter michiganensis]
MRMMYAIGQIALSTPRRPAPASAGTGMPNMPSATATSATSATPAACSPVSLNPTRQTRNRMIGIAATSAESHGTPSGSGSWIHMSVRPPRSRARR